MFSMSAAFLCLPKAALEKAFLIVYFPFALPFCSPQKIFPLRRFVILCMESNSSGRITEHMAGGWWSGMLSWKPWLVSIPAVFRGQSSMQSGSNKSHVPRGMLLSFFSFFSKLSSFTTSEKVWRAGLGNWMQDLYFAENYAEWDMLREGQQWWMGTFCWAKSKATCHSI